MASLTAQLLNLNIDELIEKIREGNKYLVDNGSCPTYFNGIDTVNHKEYKQGDEFMNVFRSCFGNEGNYTNLFCRTNFYKTKNPSKAAHGKIFEDTFNQVIACAYDVSVAEDSDKDIFKKNYILKGKKGNFELPFFKNVFIPQLEWQHDALDVTVDHYNSISKPLKKIDEGDHRQTYLLHEKMSYTFEVPPEEPIMEIKTKMKKIMGNGLNIKYSKGKQYSGDDRWFPDKAEMADFKNFWDDTHSTEKFNPESIKILPFVGVWGVWEDVEIASIPQKIHYKCGRSIWFIKFEDNAGFQNKLWGDWGDDSIKTELEILDGELQQIQTMAEAIKENPDIYIKALAIYYGNNIPTSGSAYKIIQENKIDYNKHIRDTSVLDLVNKINGNIKEKGGVLKLNQKAFSYDASKKNPFRPARIQVGFIPSKIKEFLISFGTYVNEYGNDVTTDKILLSRLLMPIQFTRSEEIQDKAKKTKKAVKQKLKIKVIKELFRITKKKGWHTESVAKIKKSTIADDIGKWNDFAKVKENVDFQIPTDYSTDLFISDKMEQIYNNVKVTLTDTVGGGMVGGGEAFGEDVSELKDIIDKLDDIDLLMDDCQVEDSLIMYDIENELNKYNYIVEKEEQNIGSEEVLYEVKNILVDNRVKLYNQQLKDIPVFIDIDFLIEKCVENETDVNIKNVNETFIDLLKNYSDSLVDLYKGINEVQDGTDKEKIELYTAFATFKEYSTIGSSQQGGMPKKSEKTSPFADQVHDLTVGITYRYNKLFEEELPDNLNVYIKQLLDDIDITQNKDSEFTTNLWQIFDNLFERFGVDYKLWSEQIIRTRSVSRGRIDSLIKRPSSTDSITKEFSDFNMGVKKSGPSINTSDLENVSASPLTSPELARVFGFPKDTDAWKLGRTRRLSDAEKLLRTTNLLSPKPQTSHKGYLHPSPQHHRRTTSFEEVPYNRSSAPTSPRRLFDKRGRGDRSTENSSMRSSNFRAKKKLETQKDRDNLAEWSENPTPTNLEKVWNLITDRGSNQGEGSSQGMSISSDGSDTGLKNVIGLSHLKQSWSSSTSDNLPDEEKLNGRIDTIMENNNIQMGHNLWKSQFLAEVELKKKIIEHISNEDVLPGQDNVNKTLKFNYYIIESIKKDFKKEEELEKLRKIFEVEQFVYDTPSDDSDKKKSGSDSDEIKGGEKKRKKAKKKKTRRKTKQIKRKKGRKKHKKKSKKKKVKK